MPKWSGGDVPLGLKVPETREQEQLLQKTAELVLRGMINAAKADGQISPGEVERIVGKLRETGLDDSSQQWLIAEPQNPLDLSTFADEIPNQEVAAKVYAASLLAVDVDTPAEQRYLQDLAQLTGPHPDNCASDPSDHGRTGLSPGAGNVRPPTHRASQSVEL